MSGSGSVQGDAQLIEAGQAQVQGQGSVTADSVVVAGPQITQQRFLATFPEFNDASKYPDLQRKLWLNMAVNNVNVDRWGDNYELGVYLFAAHHLAIFGNQRGRPGIPGRIPYPMGSKSVGSVSASYDTSIIQGMGFWGLSTYGLEYYRIARMAGAGGVQIGYGPLPLLQGPGFAGPDMGDWPGGGGF